MIALPFFPGTLRFREADFFRVFNSVAHGFCADPGMIFVHMQLLLLLYKMSGTDSILLPENRPHQNQEKNLPKIAYFLRKNQIFADNLSFLEEKV